MFEFEDVPGLFLGGGGGVGAGLSLVAGGVTWAMGDFGMVSVPALSDACLFF